MRLKIAVELVAVLVLVHVWRIAMSYQAWEMPRLGRVSKFC